MVTLGLASGADQPEPVASEEPVCADFSEPSESSAEIVSPLGACFGAAFGAGAAFFGAASGAADFSAGAEPLAPRVSFMPGWIRLGSPPTVERLSW